MDSFPMSSVIARSAIKDTIDFCQPLASISGVAVVTDYGESKKNDYMVVSNALRLQQVSTLKRKSFLFLSHGLCVCVVYFILLTNVIYFIMYFLKGSHQFSL